MGFKQVNLEKEVNCSLKECANPISKGQAIEFFNGKITCLSCYVKYLDELMDKNSLSFDEIDFKIVEVDYK